MTLSRFLLFVLIVCTTCFGTVASAATDNSALSQQIQTLKKGVLNLNSQLNILENKLLYPSSETAFFLSVDVGTPIRLVDVNVSLDGKHVAYHYYTRQEFEALTKGGIQRLFHGNVSSGQHMLSVKITGYNPHGRNYKRTSQYSFTKGPGRKYIELHISEDLNTMKPLFEFREWNK